MTSNLKMIYNVIGMRKTRKGFTLVELLIVMGIIAIFGGMTAVISVTGNLQKGRDGRRQTDLEAIRSALEIYRSDNGTYPPGSPPAGVSGLSPTYMTTVPTDPKTPTLQYPYAGLPAGCTGAQSNRCTTYNLCATREITTPLAYCVTNP